MKSFINGLLTGLTLQFAIGPVFFFIMNLVLQKSSLDGVAGVLAVTLVDYLYISLSIIGIGKLLEHKKIKTTFGIVSSLVLIGFGLLTLRGAIAGTILKNTISTSSNILTSFTSVFFLTISSPMTILFFTSLFTTKAVEYNYTKRELVRFGFGTGFATFLFMGSSVLLFSFLRGTIPTFIVQTLNGIIGCVLVGYGGLRLKATIAKKR